MGTTNSQRVAATNATVTSQQSLGGSPRRRSKASDKSAEKLKAEELAEQVIGRRRRTRRQPDMDCYKTKTMDKIKELNAKIAASSDQALIKRLKN